MGQIKIEALDGEGSFDAYCAEPDQAPRAAVVVVQEAFGVNDGIRARCERWASDGYLALAPDLYWRIEPRIELDPDRPGDLQRGIGLLKEFDIDKAVADIEATIRKARDRAGGRKVGVVGYCIGGQLAFLSATRTDAEACVGYYGGGIDGRLGEAHAIANPLMLHFAEQDHFINADVRTKIRSTLSGNPKVEIHDYPGVDHGFATEAGKRRDEAAARQADERTATLFAQVLEQPV